jgi:hypothetical protein
MTPLSTPKLCFGEAIDVSFMGENAEYDYAGQNQKI